MSSAKARSTFRTVINTADRTRSGTKGKASTATVRDWAANELVFAVVAPVGAGPSKVAFHLEELLAREGYQTSILKAGDVISEWAIAEGLLDATEAAQSSPTKIEKDGRFKKRNLETTRHFQDWGDRLRETTGDNAAVALGLIRQIRLKRARQQTGQDDVTDDAIVPDGQLRAFILDSIRHPDEVSLLRRVYQDAFWLIGVFSHEKERERRLSAKYEAGTEAIRAFMLRDENAPELNGQKVAEAFHLSDYFVNNTEPEKIAGKKGRNPKWDVIEQLGRLLDILLHKHMTRPFEHETGMFHAYGARMKSSCISRQVGAALVGAQGDLISTGTNEVPRAGGGTLSEDVIGHGDDHRCFAHNGYCSNVTEQNDIIEALLTEVSAFRDITANKQQLIAEIRRTRIGQLVEFSRAVHAEMDALLSAARSGVSTVNSRLYVTTFPCHSCARHVIAAGVMEVQYIEPYFQSRAFRLHDDAITDDPDVSADEDEPPRVLFRPFIGVAPRLYRRAFYKDRRMKDLNTGKMLDLVGSPDGPSSSEVLRISYAQLEAHLAKRAGLKTVEP